MIKLRHWRENLLDQSERWGKQGSGWILILLVLALMSLAVRHFSQGVNQEDSMAQISNRASPSRSPRDYSIFYNGGVFSPTNLRIHQGDTVKFKNDSPEPIWIISDPHPEHNILLSLNSQGEVAPESDYAYLFSQAGIFRYHNEKNPNETGTIIVR